MEPEDRQLVQPNPQCWPYQKYLDVETCKFYFVNQETGETYWDAPVGLNFDTVY